MSIVVEATDSNDDDIEYVYAWTQNGILIEHDESTLPSSFTTKGEEWGVSVFATDGDTQSDPVSDSVMIGNAAPEIAVSIAPEIPVHIDDLVATVTENDPDGDPLTLTYTWSKDDEATTFESDTIAASETLRDEVWKVTVTANDGELDSDPVEASVTIANTLPEVSDLVLSPETVYETDTISAALTTSDIDNDPWISIVPKELLPVPTVADTNSGNCQSAYEFSYPYALLPHLYYQIFLSPTAFDEAELFDSNSSVSTFDPCGQQQGSTTDCGEDWDGDGVLDENEPMPTTFLGQVQTMQCTANGNQLGWSPIGLEAIDIDEQDEDNLPTVNSAISISQRSVSNTSLLSIDCPGQGGPIMLTIPEDEIDPLAWIARPSAGTFGR